MLECEDMSASRFGDRVILPFGPNNTYKDVPPRDAVISPRGLASDSSCPIAWIGREDLPV